MREDISYHLIRIYGQYVSPTEADIALIERFLDHSAADENQKAALICLVRYWKRHEDYIDVIIRGLDRIYHADDCEIGLLEAAISESSNTLFITKNGNLYRCIETIFRRFLNEDFDEMVRSNMIALVEDMLMAHFYHCQDLVAFKPLDLDEAKYYAARMEDIVFCRCKVDLE